MAVRQVRSAVAKLGMSSPLLWIAGPPGRALIGNLGESWSLYDCSDDLTRLSVAPTLLVEERKTLDQADLVIACSQALMESKRGCRSALFWVPNGVDADHFDPARQPADVPSRLRGLRAPIIGYHGAVYNRIDWDLVRFACKAQPDWSFVFMGPVHEAPPAEVAVLPNLHLVGEVPFEELPHLYRGCAACWVPHKVNDLTERQSSLKIYEYLAAGRPTVATRLPLAPDLAGMIGTGSSHQQIVDALRTALATDSPKRASERVKVARANSWTTRLAAYGDALTTVAAGTDAA
jgi:UDP-galactopyranose mutase